MKIPPLQPGTADATASAVLFMVVIFLAGVAVSSTCYGLAALALYII